jgi:hypothetical protein
MSDFAHHGPGSIAVPSLRNSIDIENGLSGPNRCRRRHSRRPVAHSADGFSGQNELARHYIDAIHPGKQHIISSASVQDQELTIGQIRPAE